MEDRRLREISWLWKHQEIHHDDEDVKESQYTSQNQVSSNSRIEQLSQAHEQKNGAQIKL